MRKDDTRSDIFFLGCMYYNMLTGVPPNIHKITWNDDSGNAQSLTVPTVFELAKNAGYTTAMVAGSFAVITIMTKNSVLEEIHKQYVLTARAKGVGERSVMWRHVFRNALIPIMTGFPAAFVGAFFSSSLLIETLFSLDGLGLLSYESVIRRDYPVVLGSLFFFTLIGLVTTLIRDLSYLWVDPRVKYD